MADNGTVSVQAEKKPARLLYGWNGKGPSLLSRSRIKIEKWTRKSPRSAGDFCASRAGVLTVLL